MNCEICGYRFKPGETYQSVIGRLVCVCCAPSEYSKHKISISEQILINETAELKSTIARLEGEKKLLEQAGITHSNLIGEIIAKKHLKIEKLELENGKLWKVVKEFIYISKGKKDLTEFGKMIKSLEEQTEGK